MTKRSAEADLLAVADGDTVQVNVCADLVNLLIRF